jgi:long-chain fatty acid transport protein
MVTNLQLMQFGVPIAYKMDQLTIGITPLLQYGALDMQFGGTLDTSSAFAGGMAPATTATVGHDAGVSQDLKFGYTLGAAYEMGDLTFGASYKAKIDMDYKDQISQASAEFSNFGMFGGTPLSDSLSTPAEIGVGASYVMGANTFAIDYKQIKWSDADGYKEFKWEDQNVIALGYQYKQKGWSLRAGYNYASNPVKEQAAATAMGDATGSAINMFNALGFPAIVESHYSLGGCYQLSDMTRLDFAYTYAPEVKETYSTAGFAGFGPMNPQSTEIKHSQTGISVAVTMNF